MNWFTNLFTSGVSDVISSVGIVIDSLTTTDEEKLILKNKLKQEINSFKEKQLNAVAVYDKEITQRHKSDMMSESFLSKNIRPLALIFLTVSVVILAYSSIFILEVEKSKLVEPWINMFQTILFTIYAFYFGSRGLEKITKLKQK